MPGAVRSATRRRPSPGDDAALARLEAGLASLGPVCVAFSGGVDSSLVLAAAVRALGADRRGRPSPPSRPTYLPEELEVARRLAAGLGCGTSSWRPREFDDPSSTGNPASAATSASASWWPR